MISSSRAKSKQAFRDSGEDGIRRFCSGFMAAD
jgi:hypothetical protein